MGGDATPVPVSSSRSGQRVELEERVKVLVVDDDPNDLRYVRDTLVNAGYVPIVTGDPEEALRLMEHGAAPAGAAGPDAARHRRH